MKKVGLIICNILFVFCIIYVGCDTYFPSASDDEGKTETPSEPPVDTETPTEPPVESGYRIIKKGSVTTTHGAIDVANLTYRTDDSSAPIVYMTKNIESEGLMNIYKALGVDLSDDTTVVKIHSGEGPGSNNLEPEYIKELVNEVNGVIADTLTIYNGPRDTFDDHWDNMIAHNYIKVFTEQRVDIMDAEGDFVIEIKDEYDYLTEKNIVGASFPTYNNYLVLSHFKGHHAGGFGGALKNMSIGFASQKGKSLIHTAGQHTDKRFPDVLNFVKPGEFHRTMAEAAMSVHEYVKDNSKEIIYISVMNNLTKYCDCWTTPGNPVMSDIGIFASLDPVALDRASVDFVYAATPHDSGGKILTDQMEDLSSLQIFDQAEKIGFGSLNYQLASTD